MKHSRAVIRMVILQNQFQCASHRNSKILKDLKGLSLRVDATKQEALSTPPARVPGGGRKRFH